MADHAKTDTMGEMKVPAEASYGAQTGSSMQSDVNVGARGMLLGRLNPHATSRAGRPLVTSAQATSHGKIQRPFWKRPTRTFEIWEIIAACQNK